MHGIDTGISAEITDDCSVILEQNDCPNTTEVFRHALQLPFYERMSEGNIRYVAEVLNKLF